MRPIPYQLVRGYHQDRPGVLLMMHALDFRLRDRRFGYELVGNALYDRDRHRLVADGVRYRVYADWTVKELS